MARRPQTFTIYDVMEAKGVFSSNPANAECSDYKPQLFPKMLYHPEGQRKVTVPAEIQVTPFGPRYVNEQTEIVSRVVNDEAEEAKALKEGWHSHPSKAMAAAGEDAPAVSSDERIAALHAEMARANAELEELRAFKLAKEGKPSGAVIRSKDHL